MPWTADDADKHHANLSPDQKAEWAKMANAMLQDCESRGGSDCEGHAIRGANARMMKRIAKLDKAKHLVYGWASVVATADGALVEDLQGDLIDPADLEDAAVDFMLDYRKSGEMHEGRAAGTVVEALVASPEKYAAMGVPESVAKAMPSGLWLGVKVTPDVFAKVEAGHYRMFSIEGTATPEPV